MKKIKLSAPQIELLRDAASERGAHAVESFAPRRKLIEIGFIFVREVGMSETLRATDDGVAYLASLADVGSPVPLTEWQREQLHWMTTSDVTDITAPAQMKVLLARALVTCSGSPDEPKSIWIITDAGRRAVAGYRR